MPCPWSPTVAGDDSHPQPDVRPDDEQRGLQVGPVSQLITAAGADADAARRKQTYSQINDVLLDECFAVVISQFRPKLALRAAVHDVGPTLHEGFAYTDTWLES
jgi:hypothetical protein